MARSNKTEIFVHCTATRPDWMSEASVEDKLNEIRRWHVETNGWRDVAYALIIDRDGSSAKGRDLDDDGDILEETAAAARGHNKTGIHIALVGGHGSTENDLFTDHFTKQQSTALRHTIADIEAELGRKLTVRGHNEVAAKACPGFKVGPWYHKKPARNVVESNTIKGVLGGGAGVITAGGAVVTELEGTSQLIAIGGFILISMALIWIFRERIIAWNKGRR